MILFRGLRLFDDFLCVFCGKEIVLATPAEIATKYYLLGRRFTRITAD